jgi:prolyl oligopeptidase PreP (S9A serine peptidase family)
MKETTDNSLLGADHVWHSGGINSLKGLSVTDFTAVVESITAKGLAVGTRILGTGRG